MCVLPALMPILTGFFWLIIFSQVSQILRVCSWLCIMISVKIFTYFLMYIQSMHSMMQGSMFSLKQWREAMLQGVYYQLVCVLHLCLTSFCMFSNPYEPNLVHLNPPQNQASPHLTQVQSQVYPPTSLTCSISILSSMLPPGQLPMPCREYLTLSDSTEMQNSIPNSTQLPLMSGMSGIKPRIMDLRLQVAQLATEHLAVLTFVCFILCWSIGSLDPLQSWIFLRLFSVLWNPYPYQEPGNNPLEHQGQARQIMKFMIPAFYVCLSWSLPLVSTLG